MNPKIIKTEADHAKAMARIEEIFAATPGTPEGDELDLLTMLVEQFEKAAFPIGLPDPVAAIRFRMDQQGLKNKDLIPFIGSASKVSEVLSGQRTLSLTMIRNLVQGLDIPAEVLIGEPGAKLDPNDPALQGNRFPLAEMVKRKWFDGFNGTLAEAKAQSADLLTAFAALLGKAALQPAFNRQQVRSGSKPNEYALTAWRIRASNLALRQSLPPYKAGTVTVDFVGELVRLSYLNQGPRLAQEFLTKNGVHIVVVEHLAKTFLDGAALRLPDGSPVVALTLRHDRLDNFWFTLCHDLAHVVLHLDRHDIEVFYDNLDESSLDRCEKEADEFATNALIPKRDWTASGLQRQPSAMKVISLANALRISPAIPAGRVRFERKNFTLFQDLVGNKKVRSLFTEWPN
jgi:HTH-type transcriptional regulator/antitoxin HigA